MPTIEELTGELFTRYGPRGWWPLLEWNEETQEWHCRYRPGDYIPPSEPLSCFEIGVGAILTQNTAWKGVVHALINLKKAGLLTPRGLFEPGASEEIRRLIRPSGYFNQKQMRLRGWAGFFLDLSGRTPERPDLLSLNGVGPETADSILLYAYGRPLFIADAYARRIMGRFFRKDWNYDTLAEAANRSFEGLGEGDRLRMMGEAHALLVEHGKRFCRKKPDCGACFLRKACPEAEKTCSCPS